TARGPKNSGCWRKNCEPAEAGGLEAPQVARFSGRGQHPEASMRHAPQAAKAAVALEQLGLAPPALLLSVVERGLRAGGFELDRSGDAAPILRQDEPVRVLQMVSWRPHHESPCLSGGSVYVIHRLKQQLAPGPPPRGTPLNPCASSRLASSPSR